ncbi:MAG: carbohydrate kinase family protein [Hoeflea sp.]|uniref:carbohydrate kinase family protein n=1 Tax=Hoeflea sp. TaxID=1940281 RepID=UPI00329A07D1
MPSPTFDVVAVGEVNADLILSGDVVPAFGQTEKLVEDARLVIGSSTAIFACGAARLGLRTALIGKVGDDILGRFMVDALNERGVDTSGIIVDPHVATGLSVILSTGLDRAILTAPGGIPALRYSEIDLSIIHSARHLHLGGYFLLDNLRPDIPHLFKKARQSGLTTSLDTNFDPAGKWDAGLEDLLAQVDVFMPNETEAKAIAKVDDVEAAIGLIAKTARVVAVKMGSRGAVAQRRDMEQVSLDAPSIGVVDTVGAGDSFDAGFLFGFLTDQSLISCLRLGIACGSLSTGQPGGTEGQPEIQKALQFIHYHWPKGEVR